jgi:hypothetical protein
VQLAYFTANTKLFMSKDVHSQNLLIEVQRRF